MNSKKQSKIRIFLSNFFNSIKSVFINRFLTGLVVIIPLGVTYYVIQFLYLFIANRLGPITGKVFYNVPTYFTPLVSLLLIVLGIYGLGLLTNMFIGRRLISFFEWILERIPFIKTIYNATKQVVSIFTKPKNKEQSGPAVFVDFPYPGVKSIALITNSVELEGMGKYITVFVPTTPNPTSGYFEMIPCEFVGEEAKIPMEEIVTMLLSGGIVTPESLKVKNKMTDTESKKEGLQ